MRHYFIVFCLMLLPIPSIAEEVEKIRIGVQSSGTLAWELAAIKEEGSLENNSWQVEQIVLANPEAGKIALHSNESDIIVSDWFWVSKMRAEGKDFVFYPYSSVSGALVVPGDSTIQSVRDLIGKKLGIAGGELDKNWLLLQAYARHEKIDLDKNLEKIFGAPPLLTEQLKLGRLDAVLTYWHYGARLEAAGYRRILDGKSLLSQLGITENLPTLGYVFRQSWADAHKAALTAFLKASAKAKLTLCTSEQRWQKVMSTEQPETAQAQESLRRRYCEGLITTWGEPEQKAAERLYSLLKSTGHSKLIGELDNLMPGTFWRLD